MKNKKGNLAGGMFGFFFILMIFSALFFFITYGMHFILEDYALAPTEEIAGTLLDINGTAMNNIRTFRSQYLDDVLYFDIFFLIIIISSFIESTIAAIKTKERGFMSFFGLMTIGNLFLIFVLTLATKIQGWFLNDILYNIITVSFETPFLTFFFNYSIYICVIWFVWVIAINQVNLDSLKEKFQEKISNKSDLLGDGRFEE